MCISYLTAPGILLPQVGLHVQCSNEAGSSFPQVANAYDTSAVGLAASQGGSRTGNLVFDPSNPSYLYTVFAYENVEDGPNPSAFLHNVGVAVSNDGGATWHDHPVHINPDISAKYDNQFVNVAVDKAGVVYVAYSDNHGIFYQYSRNHGQTFSAPFQVSQGTDTAVMPWLPSVSADVVTLATPLLSATAAPMFVTPPRRRGSPPGCMRLADSTSYSKVREAHSGPAESSIPAVTKLPTAQTP